MILESVFISNIVKQKILTKHNIDEEEIKNILLYDKPIFRKVKGAYLCIGFKKRYLTIIFSYNTMNKEAEIITAYPSSKWQKNLYKRMKK